MCSYFSRLLPAIVAYVAALPIFASAHFLPAHANSATMRSAFSACQISRRQVNRAGMYFPKSHQYFTSLSASQNANAQATSNGSSQQQQLSPAEMRRLEAEVEASAMARLDKERVKKALQNKQDDMRNNFGAPSSSMMEYDIGQPPSRMKIAFAAGTSAATVALLALHTPLPVGACAFVVVAAYAAVDPLDDGGGIFAPLARILGRATIETTNEALPRVKGAILAATTGEEEISRLKRRVQELEKENAKLKQYMGIRETVDDNMNAFTLDELRDYARRNGVVFSGRTKAQLFATLLERGIIKIN